jgi:hypothetical protein
VDTWILNTGWKASDVNTRIIIARGDATYEGNRDCSLRLVSNDTNNNNNNNNNNNSNNNRKNRSFVLPGFEAWAPVSLRL